jgi:hypothetical protein
VIVLFTIRATRSEAVLSKERRNSRLGCSRRIAVFLMSLTKRKARDSNPHSPGGNRVSSAARPTVSGYLPVKSMREGVDHRGVEPRSPGCKPGVFPLDQQPVSVDHRQRSARESNSVPLLTRKGCRRRTRGPSCFILGFTSHRIAGPGFEPRPPSL